jgi:hypothetical protein
MAPDIIVVRHGQAEHNVAFDAVGDTAYEDARYRDSKLTHAGALPLQSLSASRNNMQGFQAKNKLLRQDDTSQQMLRRRRARYGQGCVLGVNVSE